MPFVDDIYVPSPQYPWIESCSVCGGQKHKGHPCEECAYVEHKDPRLARWVRGYVKIQTGRRR